MGGSLDPSGQDRGALLLVDDDDALLRAHERLLRADGYRVQTASDGESAAALLRDGAFDVVVSDIAMPRVDGLQLLRRVREHDLGLPVVLITGGPTLDTAMAAVELGAVRYLTKPIDAALLRQVVEQAVALRRAGRVRGPAPSDPRRAQLAERLTRGLETLWMAFQPIVAPARRRVFGYEGLLRCGEPTLANPLTLLAAAEELGRLSAVGRLVRAHAAWTVVDMPADRNLFINLHARDLIDETLFLPEAPLSRSARRVVLEITERASLSEVSGLAGRLAALRELGYRFALDDLGAGYAGLNSLAQLEPEFIKIDLALVRNVHQQPTQQAIIRSVVSLARDTGAQVIGEGVETPAERDELLRLGCELHQGYLYARPARALPDIAW